MQVVETTKGYAVINDWLLKKGLHPFRFQKETWQHIIDGDSGLVNAPTGCGKTFSVFLGALIDFINQHPDNYGKKSRSARPADTAGRGLQLLWITPLRALAKDIGRAMEEVIDELQMSWRIGIRNGDTDIAERQKQTRQMPEVLIITPESLHLLLAQKNYPEFFGSLKVIAIDEWHELLGSKRGVQVELAISRIVNVQSSMFNVQCSIWGISATIGNLDQAREVLLSPIKTEGIIVTAEMQKKVEIESIFPDEIEKFPWSGHLGIKLV